MKLFGRKKEKEVKPPEPEVTYESFSAAYFPDGKLAEGYLPEHAAKIEAIRERLRHERDAKQQTESKETQSKELAENQKVHEAESSK